MLRERSRRRLGLLGVLASLVVCPAAAVAGTVEIRLSRPDDPRAHFVVTGLDPTSLDALRDDASKSATLLKVTTDGAADAPALLGSYALEGDRLLFRPRFPLEPGVRYRVTVKAGETRSTAVLGLPAPKPVKPSTVVVRVSPSGDVLPENLLKFYIEFSAPMGRGTAYDHLKLLDGAGRPIDLPFLELGEELWDPAGRRFTVLFDPGRIKNGLRPREEAGPVLEEGKTYTLVIEPGWRDAEGLPLREGFRRRFRVGPFDRTPPDPANWSIDAPEPGTTRPLVVRFPEPLDRAMLLRVVGVVGPDGKGVAGEPAVGEGETSWAFTPDRPWSPGEHRLVMDRSLEDRAGNQIGRPFEVDVFEKIERTSTPQTVARPFRVGAKP